MIDTHHNIIRFNTQLPYNCIFYISGKMKVDNISLPNEIDNDYISRLQDFNFHFQKIQGDSLTDEKLRKEKLIASDTNPDLSEDIALTLRKIFPKSDFGCYVVRLLPFHDQLDDSYIDDLLVGEVILQHDKYDAQNFALEAAQQNFERMTGIPFSDYQDPDYQPEFGGDTSLYDDYSFGFGFRTISFQTSKSRSQFQLQSPNVIKKQNQLKEEYLKHFKDLINDPKSTFDQLKDLIYAGYGDISNIGKLAKEYPIKIEQDNHDNYEIFVCPDKEEPILCDFPRGWQSKSLYIFFLRHPEGFRLRDLKKTENIQELAKIYAKLRICDLKVAEQKATEIVKAVSVVKNDIKDWFDQLFVPRYACNYQIEAMDGSSRNGIYGINLDDDLIDLGVFDKAL